MTTENLYLDAHVLQNVPLSNLNRDYVGAPKQVTFGGAVRARISSQCIKRAVRLGLESDGRDGKALRTRKLPELLRGQLRDQHGLTDDESVQLSKRVFGLAGIKVKRDDDSGDLLGNQLTFTTDDAAAALAKVSFARKDDLLDPGYKLSKSDKDGLLEPLHATNTIVALCGRMLAALPGSNVDGCVQIGHAFTTHRMLLELDYFTAVDDVVQGDSESAGAGHVNDAEYTSGTFYRHCTIDLRSLHNHLSGPHPAASGRETMEAASRFLRQFVVAEPTGKQNTANAHTRASLVAVTMRTDRPVSYANAFDAPVDGTDGYINASISALNEYVGEENNIFGIGSLVGAWYAAVPRCDHLGDRSDFETLLTSVRDRIGEAL